MIVLSLESSTETASCAILSEDKLYGEININNNKQHSILLMPMIHTLLESLKMDISFIDGFVVSKGPGSFTGLRIGMATIKGLCQGSNKPMVSVSSLDALANNLSYSSGVICPIIDALRGNAYTALYRFNGTKLVKFMDHCSLSLEDLKNKLLELNEEVTFAGDGINVYRDSLCGMPLKVRFAPIHQNIPLASSLGVLGLELLKDGEIDDIYTSSPLYLIKSQAERSLEKDGEH